MDSFLIIIALQTFGQKLVSHRASGFESCHLSPSLWVRTLSSLTVKAMRTDQVSTGRVTTGCYTYCTKKLSVYRGRRKTNLFNIKREKHCRLCFFLTLLSLFRFSFRPNLPGPYFLAPFPLFVVILLPLSKHFSSSRKITLFFPPPIHSFLVSYLRIFPSSFLYSTFSCHFHLQFHLSPSLPPLFSSCSLLLLYHIFLLCPAT